MANVSRACQQRFVSAVSQGDLLLGGAETGMGSSWPGVPMSERFHVFTRLHSQHLTAVLTQVLPSLAPGRSPFVHKCSAETALKKKKSHHT